MEECLAQGISDVNVDDIFVGNGVSELISMSMQALLNDGDEVLIPSPDYPLWTASVTLSGGKPVHYLCDEHLIGILRFPISKQNLTIDASNNNHQSE